MRLFLDWSDYQDAGMGDAYADIPKSGGDFAKAISVCINSHQCETNQKGVMCPSFRVTDNSALSTGGRVRLLKAALNGKLGEAAFNDPDLKQAMDLCVACKGCKRECENEVDMAMIKIEYLAQSYQHSKPGLRTQLLGNLSIVLQRLNIVRPALSKIIEWRNQNTMLARLSELLFGLSAKQCLPIPAKSSFEAQSRSDSKMNIFRPVDGVAVIDEVVLLLDTFTNNFSPENADSAIKVLTRAGYVVHVVGGGNNGRQGRLCCGRTQLAHGLVEAAKQKAARMLSALLPHVDAGRQIIGLEPACLLAIRDDYKFLGLGDAADKVSKRAILFEEFIAKEKQAKRFALSFNSLNEKLPILVHGHCYQKAVGAMKSMRKVLKLLPDIEVEFIESSCCGMAGSFGLEKEHANLAMKMAEDKLLPALSDHPQSRIIANGFSCRHQIKSGGNRQSMHLAVLLEQASA